MKNIKNSNKPSFFKKIFIKISRKLGYEIIDQNNFEIVTSGKKIDEHLSKLGNKSIQDISLEMLTISSSGLARRNQLDNRGMDERQFLDPLFDIVKNKQTGAEKLLQKYKNSWNGNINKIFTDNAF